METSTDAAGPPPSAYFWICLALVGVIALATPFAIGYCLVFCEKGTGVLDILPRLPVYAMLSGAYAATAMTLTILVIRILGTNDTGGFARPRLCTAASILLTILIAMIAGLAIAIKNYELQFGGALMSALSDDLAMFDKREVLEGIAIIGNALAVVAVTAFAVPYQR